MFKNLIYLIILSTVGLFAMETNPIKEGKQEISDFAKASADREEPSEKFPWQQLPKDIKTEVLKNYPWERIDRQNPQKFAESLIKSIKEYNQSAKSVNKHFYEYITESYNKFLNSLTEDDFKILNQYISEFNNFKLFRSEYKPLPKGFNLLVRLLIKFNKLDEANKNWIKNSLNENREINKDLQSLDELIKSGAKINAADEICGFTALMRAIINGDKERAKLLIEMGANLNFADYARLTPLMRASGHKDIVQLLINAGADLNSKDQWGHTALIQAVNMGNKEMAEALINAGADLDAINNWGETALQIAIEAAKTMDRTDIINLIKAKMEQESSRTTPRSCSVM